MTHTLETIKDADNFFVVDPITRSITNQTSDKKSVIQYDHNSEVFTFKIPLMIEEHDMSSCDSIQIHYINKGQSDSSPGIYEANDVTVIEDEGNNYVIFSWLLSQNVTKFTGDITFQIKFICYNDNDPAIFDYVWSTKVFSAIDVLPGINNTTIIVEQSADILQQWKADISEQIEIESTESDTTNLWTYGDLEIDAVNILRKVAVTENFYLEPGTYTITADVTSSDTDATYCAIWFYYSDGTIKKTQINRGIGVFKDDIILKDSVNKIEFYAASDYNLGAKDKATFKNITLINNDATVTVTKTILTAKDNVARQKANEALEELKTINNQVSNASEQVAGNLWTFGDLEIDGVKTTRQVEVSENFYLEPGSYTIVADVTSSDTDATYCGMYFYNLEGTEIKKQIKRGENAVTIFPLAEAVNKIKFFASSNYNLSANDTATFKNIILYDNAVTHTLPGLSAKDNVARQKADDIYKSRFDDSFNYVAYSQVTGSAGNINTAEHYKWASKQNFTAIKGDVRPTSDGQLVMCHDAGFCLNESGYITSYIAQNATPILSMTFEQCLALQHSNGQHVCSFEDYIRICKKYGKIAYITVRDENIVDTVIPVMFDILDKYNMRARSIINSFTFETLQAVRDVDDVITLSYVIPVSSAINEANVLNALKLGNCQICGANFPKVEQGKFDKVMEGIDIMQSAKKRGVRIYQAQMNSMEDIDRLIELGFSGAQMTIVPEL